MHGIDLKRWLLGGAVAGAIIGLLEAVSHTLYLDAMQAVLTRHDLVMTLDAGAWGILVVASLIGGLALVFFYAAARPRFGPGPRTALIVSVALWVFGYLVPLLGYHLVGVFPDGMLVLWGGIGLVELVVAGLAGGWIYREPWDQPAGTR